MSKVVITGVSGFIGSALADYLTNIGYEVIGIDRLAWVNQKDREFYLQDINDILPNIRDVDVVVHLAALAGVRNSHERFEQVCKDNILGTQRIIKKCIDNWKPRRLLLASSSSVYGDLGRDGHSLIEDEGVSPRSPYALSKVANEELMKTYKNCGMLDGIDIACMRFFTVYGPHQRNELAIRAFTDWIIRNKPITLYGDGSQKRDFTSIHDICSGIETLISYPLPFLPYDIYNIGSNNSISINKIIKMMCDITDKDVTIHYEPRNQYDVDCTNANIYRMESMGWKPKIKFEDGLKEQIEWQMEMLEDGKV